MGTRGGEFGVLNIFPNSRRVATFSAGIYLISLTGKAILQYCTYGERKRIAVPVEGIN